MELLVNIDVPDADAAAAFYCAAFGLRVGRRLGPAAVELLGAAVPLYLLENPAGSAALPDGTGPRDYGRHWTPVHLDVVVAELDEALARAMAAGARLESGPDPASWGRIARLADPFGNGICLIAFSASGYDAIATG